MTVQEVIDELSKYDMDTRVMTIDYTDGRFKDIYIQKNVDDDDNTIALIYAR